MATAIQRVKKEHRSMERWAIEDKFKAVENWLSYGNLRLTAEMTGVSISTLKLWKRADWWQDLEKEILAGSRIKQTSKISSIVDKGLEVISDRLENGEVVLDQKSGDLVRRPVALRDAAGAVNNLMQRQSILEKQSSEEFSSSSQKTIQEQLQFLAVEFAKFNGRSKLNAETIEFVEVVDNAIESEMVIESGESREDEDFPEEMAGEEPDEDTGMAGFQPG